MEEGRGEVSRASVELTFPAKGAVFLSTCLVFTAGSARTLHTVSTHAVSAAHSLEARDRVSQYYSLLIPAHTHHRS